MPADPWNSILSQLQKDKFNKEQDAYVNTYFWIHYGLLTLYKKSGESAPILLYKLFWFRGLGDDEHIIQVAKAHV